MKSAENVLKTSARGLDRLWPVGSSAIGGTIYGPLPNKSNSRQIVMVKGRAMVIKSREARAYESQFEEAVWRSLSNLFPLPDDAKLYLKATVFQENLRRDLDVELLPDLLQKFTVIKNDRSVWKKEYQRRLDRVNPRVEFEIGVLKDGWDRGGANESSR